MPEEHNRAANGAQEPAPKSNRNAALEGLAFEARRNYRVSVDGWMTAAYALAEADDLLEHGEQKAFFAKVGIPKTTAARMIRIARSGVKSTTVVLLGVAKTDVLLAALDRVDEAMAVSRALDSAIPEGREMTHDDAIGCARAVCAIDPSERALWDFALLLHVKLLLDADIPHGLDRFVVWMAAMAGGVTGALLHDWLADIDPADPMIVTLTSWIDPATEDAA